MQESAAGIARRWACFRTCCKADRPILQIGIARRRRAYARRLRRPFGRSNAKNAADTAFFISVREIGGRAVSLSLRRSAETSAETKAPRRSSGGEPVTV